MMWDLFWYCFCDGTTESLKLGSIYNTFAHCQTDAAIPKKSDNPRYQVGKQSWRP